MSDGFETLIYTDCRPGQGLRGSSGLQFQAQSPGAPPAAQATVQQHLLYEPPANWMSERRPASDYPPSFAHVADGLFATAAGVYLGREANGAREGNQLTHSIVTGDPGAYSAPIRPAQLYRAPFWTSEPAPTTTCPPIGAGWEPGPYGVEDTRDYIANQPDGARRLAILLSALHRIGGSSGTRVLFISEDPDDVMRWIVAGSLLLPFERAVQIGFKVFSTSPARAVQPVLAVHPAWGAPAAALENDLGYVVFDLIRHRTTDLEPTELASGWAYDFCERRDAYDIMDAIQLAGDSGLDLEPGAILGRAAVLGDPLTAPSATLITEWLGTTNPTLLPTVRGSLVDRLTSDVDRWPHSLILSLDGLAHSGQVPADRAAAVRVALIRTELRQAAETGQALPTQLRPLDRGQWLEGHQHDAERAVVDMLLRANPAGFDAVLRVAHRFELAVDLVAARPAVDRFVADWSGNPGRRWDPRSWGECGPAIEDQLVDAVNDRLLADPRSGGAMGRQWLPALNHRITAGQLDGPITEAIVSVWIVDRPQDRKRLVSLILNHISPQPPGDEAAGRAVTMMWSRTLPTLAELGRLAKQAPPGIAIERRIFDPLVERLRALDLDYHDLDLARELRDKHLWVPSDGHQLLEDDLTLVHACGDLLTGNAAAPRQLVDRIAQAPVRLVRARANRVARAMSHLEEPGLVVDLVDRFPFTLNGYVQCVRERLRADGPGPLAAIAFWLTRAEGLSGKAQRQIQSDLTVWVKSAREDELEVATKRVSSQGRKPAEAWQDLVTSARGRGLFKRFRSSRKD